MRVVLLDHLADGPRRLAVRAIRSKAALQHRPQDPAMDGLQAVSNIGERAPDDDGHRVVEVRALNLVLELNVLDPAGEQTFLRHLDSSFVVGASLAFGSLLGPHTPGPATHPGSERPSRWSRSTPCERGRPRP